MQRTSNMTLGFVLIFFGIQFALVDSYVLTPRVSNFLSEQSRQAAVAPGFSNAPNGAGQQFQNAQAQFSQVGFQQPLPVARPILPIANTSRLITPPRWLCWPLLFCGTVVFLHGFSKPRH